MAIILITHPSDNVGIVAEPEGIQPGTILPSDLEAKEWIPMGHKIALQHIAAGASVIRYGYTIGLAATDIPPGTWINEKNLLLPAAPVLEEISYTGPPVWEAPPLEDHYFMGYRNADGSTGTRNILGISTSVQCVAGTTDYVVERIRKELLPLYPNVDDVVALNHQYGCGVAIDAPAAIVPIRTLTNLARNPNFGGEIMVIGLGCEKLRPETLAAKEEGHSILYLQDERFHGFADMMQGIMEMANTHLQKLNQRQREKCPASALVVGMQCGGSDAFSGLTGNPVAGYAADLIVRAGGTVFFSEVTEVRDAIPQLVQRAASATVAEQLKQEMKWYDEYLARGGADRSANTTPGNKKGGLSNIVEKALGSVVKSGSSPIRAVVSHGQRVQTPGLNFVATPASDFVCGTLQLAAGMNLHLFITGRGTPYGLRMVPVIKLSSNSKLADRWHDLIDFDAGPVASGAKTVEQMGWELFRLILEVASGEKKVATDQIGLFNELAHFNPGPLT